MDSQQKQEIIRKQTGKFKANSRIDNTLPLSKVPRQKSIADEPQESSLQKQANYNKKVKHGTAVDTVKIYGFPGK